MTRLHIAKTKTRTGPALVYTPHAADGPPYLLDVCGQNVTRSTILHHFPISPDIHPSSGPAQFVRALFGGIGVFNKEDSTRKGGTVQVDR